MEFLNSLQLKTAPNETGIVTTLEYQAGRKDRVLMRMLEDEYINGAEYGEAVASGIDFIFQDPKEILLR